MCDAICIGIGTALMDDPLLLPRDVPILRHPHRYVLDTNLRLPTNSKLVGTAGEFPVTVFCSNDAAASVLADTLRDHNVEVCGFGSMSVESICQAFTQRDHTHLLIEPGPTMANAWIHAVERLLVIKSNKRIDSDTAPAAAAIPNCFKPIGNYCIYQDRLTKYSNTQSPVYFDADEMADVLGA